MNTTATLHPGQPFNAEVFKRVEGADFTFGAPGKWQALFVFFVIEKNYPTRGTYR
jgi:hypothetical protein